MGKLVAEWPGGVSSGDGPPEWTTAGIRDYWLGGSRHTATDHDVAEHILVGTPYLPYMVRAYRALLGRMVRYLVGVGVEQFLDLGSGLPTAGNVHDVAQATNPECRVVYVDIAPDIVAAGHPVLAGNDSAAVVCADLRQPEQVLDAAQRTGLLDLGVPVAVLLIDVLHHIPDTDNPIRLIQTYVDAVCPAKGNVSFKTGAHLRV
jgi:SAM-dependent methyltransferase